MESIRTAQQKSHRRLSTIWCTRELRDDYTVIVSTGFELDRSTAVYGAVRMSLCLCVRVWCASMWLYHSVCSPIRALSRHCTPSTTTTAHTSVWWRQCRQQEANKRDTSESRDVHSKWFREKDVWINKYGAKEMEQSSCISPEPKWFVRNKKANQTNYNVVDERSQRDAGDDIEVEISSDQYN